MIYYKVSFTKNRTRQQFLFCGTQSNVGNVWMKEKAKRHIKDSENDIKPTEIRKTEYDKLLGEQNANNR